MKTIFIDGLSLSLEDIAQVAYSDNKNVRVKLSTKACLRMRRSRRFIESKLQSNETIYGVNTGFGVLSSVRIDKKKLEDLQLNLLRSHAAGVGHPFSEVETRAAILLRANTLAAGMSGVRPELVDALLDLLNHGVHPWIPEQGSVGASGDLAPLAHLGLVLIGEGQAYYRGRLLSGARALRAAGLKPISIQAKEGLSLVNGTQIMTAVAVLAFLKAEHLSLLADLATACSVEAAAFSQEPFEPHIHKVRPHRGQMEVAANMKRLLSESQIMQSHAECEKVQDPYSFRCVPQVHGACRDILRGVRTVLETEVNSVTDNPLVYVDGSGRGKIINGGNFHGQYVAMAMDQMAMAVAELANISEQRTAKLVNPTFTELPAFLVRDGGLNSGLMIVHVAAASLVSENKILCHPASVDSIPTSADKEDHVSMGTIAARKARAVVENTWNVIAIEYLAATQGLEFRRPLKPARRVLQALRAIRKVVAPIKRDRVFHQDIAQIAELMRRGEIHA